MRSAVERLHGWLKGLRKMTIRYEKLAITYKTFTTITYMINNISKSKYLRHGIQR